MHNATKIIKPIENMRGIAAARIQAAAKPRKGGVGTIFRRAAKTAGIDRKNGALSTIAPAPGGVVEFDPETIRRSPFNREYFAAADDADLAESVRQHGILEPGIVRPLPEPIGKITHELIAGERRWRAAKTVKVKFPALVRAATDVQALEIQATENLQRVDLNPVDEAHKYLQLREAYEAGGATRTAAMDLICQKTGKARSTIAERMALMTLPAEVLKLTQAGALPPSHAGLLVKLSDPKEAIKLAEAIVHPKGSHKDAPGGIGAPLSFDEAKELAKKARQREENAAEYSRVEAAFKGRILDARESAKVLTGNDWGQWWLAHNSGYVKGDEYCNLPGANGSYKKCWGKKAPAGVLAMRPDRGPAVIYEKAAADQAVKDNGKLAKTMPAKKQEDPRERVLKERAEIYARIVPALVAKFESLDNKAFWTWFASAMAGNSDTDDVLERRGWTEEYFDGLLGRAPSNELRGICAEILISEDRPRLWNAGGEWGENITSACALAGLELQASGSEEANDE
jgi:ParB/RepB/Spo0J family partition protein